MLDFDTMRSPRRCALLLAILAAVAPSAALAQAPGDDDATDGRRVDVNEYIVRGNTVLDTRAIERAVTPFLGPDRTMKDIEAARDALQAAYQKQGFQSVYVDLPAQQVTGGIVFLQVNETRVGTLRVVGAQHNSPEVLREQVPALREGAVPDFNRAQAQLTELNRTGKRQVVPLVREGERPGTMDVDLKVDDQSPWRFTAALHNDYSADTEDLRATLSVSHDHPWPQGHSATLTFFGAPQDLDQASVWSASTVTPLRGTPGRLGANADSTDSSLAATGGAKVLG